MQTETRIGCCTHRGARIKGKRTRRENLFESKDNVPPNASPKLLITCGSLGRSRTPGCLYPSAVECSPETRAL
eukprot:993957-Pyramimonas_sp.AAC.1